MLCSPLELYAFNDGLVRLCTEPYTKPTVDNSGDMCMHLTNYSLNKKSEGFQVGLSCNCMYSQCCSELHTRQRSLLDGRQRSLL